MRNIKCAIGKEGGSDYLSGLIQVNRSEGKKVRMFQLLDEEQ
ncbi:hypothetical protein [Planomicrobium sp. Y74]|nr:hypothetical protein [Planomicrobium sp. Y74]